MPSQNIMEALLQMQQLPGVTMPNYNVAPQTATPSVDPNQVDPIQLQKDMLDARRREQLAQAMMGQGYVPNSGKLGVLSQVFGSLMGGIQQRRADEKLSDVMGRAATYSEQEKLKEFQQKLAEKAYESQLAIKQATGIKEGETQIGLKYGDQTAAQAAKLAGLTEGAKAGAGLPYDLAKIDAETAGKIKASVAAAEVANRRGYVVPDASGNSVVVTPQGKVIYQATTPGGGKLTPSETSLNQADTNALESFNKRWSAAVQLQQNIRTFASQYAGVPPEQAATMNKQQLVDAIKKVPTGQAVSLLNPLGNRGLDAIANDMAINAGGTKRDTITEELQRAELSKTVSRYKTPAENAAIIGNHLNDVEELAQQREAALKRITGRQTPGQPRIPTPGNAPAPSMTGDVIQPGTNDGTTVAPATPSPEEALAELRRRGVIK
jgi:hypothetical protein